MNAKTKQIDAHADQQKGAIAAAAAAAPVTRAPLDPNRPMWHLVPPSTMQDVVEILKSLPWEKVNRVMPALMQAPIHQNPPD